MKNSLKRKVIAILACLSLLTVSCVALAEEAPAAVEGDLGENAGVETITLDNGLSLTYNAYDFAVNVDVEGSVVGDYLGDLKAGFSVYFVEGGADAEAFMTESAEEYGAELQYGPCFDGSEWYYFSSVGEEDGVPSYDTQYARSTETGTWFVSVFVFPSGDEATDTYFSDAMSGILDSMTFAN